jgi:hypothetical protein
VDGDGSQGLIFRDNSGGVYMNSIFGDFKGQPGAPALTIEDVSAEASEDSRKRLEAGDLKLLNNFWFDFAAGTALEDLVPQEFVRINPNFAGNQITDPQLRGISRDTDGGLDPRLADESPARGAADMSLYTDAWFDQVSYVGAFENKNWLRGWTALYALGYANSDDFVTDIEPENEVLPVAVELLQNYPNPFNPATTIQFALPYAQQITLKVYDITGREVAVLAQNQTFGAGSQTVAFDASDLSSGVYIYRLFTQSGSVARSMTLIK